MPLPQTSKMSFVCCILTIYIRHRSSNSCRPYIIYENNFKGILNRNHSMRISFTSGIFSGSSSMIMNEGRPSSLGLAALPGFTT